MRRRAYGTSGLEVSVVGLGAGALGRESLTDAQAERLLDAALDLGVTLIDTAPSYGASERRIGRWLRGRRGAIVLSTKGGYGADGAVDWTGEAVRLGIDQALVRLQTEHIDIFHLHSCPRPVAARVDILEALDRAREAGKIRVAAYSGENEALEWASRSGRFGGLQCSVNLFDQRSLGRTVPEASAAGMGIIGKRALGNAPWRFTERPRGDYAEEYWLRLQAMGLEPGALGWEALALRFAAFAPGVSAVLVGTASAEHLAADLRAVAEGELPAELVSRVRAAFDAKGAEWEGKI